VVALEVHNAFPVAGKPGPRTDSPQALSDRLSADHGHVPWHREVCILGSHWWVLGRILKPRPVEVRRPAAAQDDLGEIRLQRGRDANQ